VFEMEFNIIAQREKNYSGCGAGYKHERDEKKVLIREILCNIIFQLKAVAGVNKKKN
jgi:hypothetical protein